MPGWSSKLHEPVSTLNKQLRPIKHTLFTFPLYPYGRASKFVVTFLESSLTKAIEKMLQTPGPEVTANVSLLLLLAGKEYWSVTDSISSAAQTTSLD